MAAATQPDPAPLRRLVAVDADTGETVSREVQALQDRIASLEEALKEAEKDLRTKRGQITKLKRDMVTERLEYHDREKVVAVHDYWNRRMGHNLALTADRFDAVRGILEERRIVVVDGKARKMPAFEYPAAFKAAVDGGWFDPYTTVRKNGTVHRHNDLALICRDGKTFQSFIDRAPVA